ncbi:lytic murein transglycosylase [Bauldia sp.]|uniref:lytic murein transglycosylase n=1 Tax=Bauldia sp. TaxID=2575872 RepID=UPI0025BF6D01|nr:lytic murein transglycosylase [Bauldia sp.]
MATGLAHAVDRRAIERDFQAFLANEIWPEAQAAGVSRTAFNAALGGVTLDWDLPELVPPGTSAPHTVESQAEFRSPGAYFNQNNLNTQVAIGRRLIKKWGKTLAAIEQRFGVPGEIPLAIWARETSFGNAKLPYSAIRTLATRAYMGRRKAFFRPELIAALQIVEAGDIKPSQMKSSWAGALGQPQFLPSYYLNYAVDFDGDGHRDIWNSVPDTLASIANFLLHKGWDPERGWGIEAAVPAAVPCYLEGPEQGRGMAEWGKLGVTWIDGRPLPRIEQNREAFLLMPAGRLGPAFIVSGNFYVLKEYNYSDLYALYVGHLADRFADNKPFVAKWGKVGGFSRADVARMQRQFEAQGFDVGGSDGLVGFKTRITVGQWQAKNGDTITCLPDAGMIRSIH